MIDLLPLVELEGVPVAPNELHKGAEKRPSYRVTAGLLVDAAQLTLQGCDLGTD